MSGVRRVAVFISFFLMAAGPCYGQELLSKILEGIRNNYGSLSGLSVGYEREIITRSMALMGDAVSSDRAKGKIHFMPPYFLKVEQESPSREILTTDGKTLWWYIPRKNQVHRYPTERLGPELRLLSDVFRGLRGVEEGFVVSLTEEEEGKPMKLEITPSPPWPDITRIDLHVSRPGYVLQRVEIHNIVGGLTRFNLDAEVIPRSFEEGFFRFEIPEGVKVIEE